VPVWLLWCCRHAETPICRVWNQVPRFVEEKAVSGRLILGQTVNRDLRQIDP
jgi:hypothetical protein